MNNNKVETKLVTLDQIFENRFFTIPDYQRGYSWSEEQLLDLRHDIENLIGKDYQHYTGTIVATINQNKKYEIVDGQQRITTLIILISQALGKLSNSVALRIKYISTGGSGNKNYILTTNGETREFFKKLILKGEKPTPTIKSHHRIIRAQKFFNDWFLEKNCDVAKIVELVQRQLGFIFFTPVNSSEAGMMFEVINNRGKPLSELEKIKNYFIYYSSIYKRAELKEDVNERWGNILRKLSAANVYSNEDENRFLRNCYLVFFDASKDKSWHVYEQLKIKFRTDINVEEELINNIETLQKFILFIEKASMHYAYLFGNSHFNTNYHGNVDHKNKIDQALKRLRCQPAKASVMPLYIACMSYLADFPEKVIKFLELIEIVNFRVYLLPKVMSRSDSQQSNLFKWANTLYNERDWTSENHDEITTEYFSIDLPKKTVKGDIFARIETELIQLTRVKCHEEVFVQSLTIDDDETDNYFYWKAIRYFLASYEEKLQEINQKITFDIEIITKQRSEIVNNKTNDFLSLEHIWASQNKPGSYDKFHMQKRRLGNLVLLGLSKNIQLSHKDIPDKINELNSGDTKKGLSHMMLQQVDELKSIYEKSAEKLTNYKNDSYYNKLSTHINDARETRMIKFALERWRLPGEEFLGFIKVTSFDNKNKPLKSNIKYHMKVD